MARQVEKVKIDVGDIAGAPGARGRYAICEDVAPAEQYSLSGRVTGELTVENTGSLLLVRGWLRAPLKLTCARCLRQREHVVEMAVEEEFASETTAPDVETVDRDEPETAAISGYVLDATELVRQQIVVSLPMAFVCGPDCRGLCPTCGKDLNEGPCDCEAGAADDRWSKLKELL